MYAVIFTATTNPLDDEYSQTAAKMRDLAFSKYGCLELNSVCQGDQEITVSYWPTLAHISAWQADPAHRAAQALGKQKWYKEYSVQVTHIERQYQQKC